MQKVHELKILPQYFKCVVDGTKNFELRKNDRAYRVGDVLLLKEFENNQTGYTGKEIKKVITYIFYGGAYGLNKDYVILSIK